MRTMEVILLERIESLGQMGDVVSVKPGYARNYLLPQKKALRANDGNRKVFEERRAQLEAENLERKSEAEQVAKTLDGMTVVLVRAAGESGQLYGSVSARDISDAVTAAGVTVGRSQVKLDKALKALGLEPVRVQLHPEVSVNVTVNIARSQDEAETQARLGRALDRGVMDEEERMEDEAPEVEELLDPEAVETEEEKAEA
ncbi:50S ribosomal protein L9 [Thalassobaculum sp. OXR-137]|nr:50S ribosomal protein L9 [Thalassobaculum sp. OXR-137]WPZ33662.1 50S ribosomal protein L9 [Thalassobaculum sp. OXR-137]